MGRLIKINPNKKRAKSILKMADVTIEMIKSIDVVKFSSNVIKEYYDVLQRFYSSILSEEKPR